MKKLLFVTSILVILSCGKKEVKSPLEEKKEYFKSVHSGVESGTTGLVAQAINKGQFKYDVQNIPDGDYEGITPEDDYKYQHRIRFTVKDGKINYVDYNEIHGNNEKGKKENKEYWASMKVNLQDAYGFYEKQLLENQNVKDMDAVTGATYSMYRFKIAFAYALEPDLREK